MELLSDHMKLENTKSDECPFVYSGESSQFQRKINLVVKKGSQATGETQKSIKQDTKIF